MPEKLLDLQALLTLVALVFLTQAIVHMTKRMRWPKKLPTLVYAWCTATVLVILGQLANYPGAWANWRTYLLGVLNGVVVAYTAAKNNDLSQDKKQEAL